MKSSLLQELEFRREQGRKSFAVLIDPDKTGPEALEELIPALVQNKADYIFVGGSLVTGNALHACVSMLKKLCQIPVILFPGNSLHLCPEADAILFLSLISGRNPEFLIGQHVIAAPLLKNSGLQILPVGYMLVDSGAQTTVSYISNTNPLPRDKPEIAACTAMAGEMLGLRLMFLDAGSGAQMPVSSRMIRTVSKAVDTPLFVGGGINNARKASEAWEAGADVVVVGNGIEENRELMGEISKIKMQLNAAGVLN
ncbi:MAG: geranylgeranylglyceryl/heptaprenylglyceryl phosphate synthase [Bacteroidota bacterium]